MNRTAQHNEQRNKSTVIKIIIYFGKISIQHIWYNNKFSPPLPVENKLDVQDMTETTPSTMPAISPAQVLAKSAISEDYLCPPQANIYGIDFTRFKIRDVDSGTTLFEIAKPPAAEEGEQTEGESETPDLNAGRFVRYQFTPQVSDT